MNRVKRKLNSERGASITYALLIFLVCAVVGSAVLVAGTAAAGRMSKVTVNDQRYYAVTSAARMLIDLIDDKPVTVIKEEAGTGTDLSTTYTYIDTDGITDTAKSLPLHAAEKVISSSPPELGYDISVGNLVGLSVSVEEEYRPENSDSIKTMVLTVKNTHEGASTDDNIGVYSLILFFNLDRNDVVEVIQQEDSTGEIIKTTSNLTWHLREVQVLGANRW